MTARPASGAGLLTDERGQISFAIRASGHLTLALLAWPKRNRLVVAGALALSLAADGWRRLPSTSRGRHRARSALGGGVDGALWTLLAPPGPEAGIAVQFLIGSTTGLGVAVDRDASADASSGSDRIPFLAAAIASQLMVLAARRRTGQGFERFLALPPIVTTAAVLAVVHHRDALHEAARAAWRKRAARHVALEHQAASVTAAVSSTPGHDFKKTLVALGELGSRRAWEAARAQSSHPAIALTRAEGTTVFRAALSIPVEPWERADTWLSADQCSRLDQFIDEVDDALEGAGPVPCITVAEVDGLQVHLRYRGRDLHLTNPSPPVSGIEFLDPTLCLLPALGAVGKMLAAFNPAIDGDVRALGPGAVIDLLGVAATAHVRSTGKQRPATVAVASMCVASAVSNLATAGLAHRSELGVGGYQVTAYATYPAVGLLAARGHRMDDRSRLLFLALIISAWAIGTGHRQPDPGRRLALGAALLIQGYLAGRGVTGGLLGDREAIETELQGEFAGKLRSARAEATADELERFRAQVDLAEEELGRLGQEADPDLVERMREQCKEVRQWLAQQPPVPVSAS